MTADKARQLWSAGAPVFAAWISSGDSFSAEVMGTAGYESVILDAQHGAITWDNMGRVLQALDLSATTTLVRVPWTHPAEIMRALDLGAAGVIVPMVSTESQARLAAEATRYPPAGIRSFGMVRNYYDVQVATAKPLCFVMIETAEAMANLEEIAATPGVDGLFVGPVDLAISLGLGAVLQVHNTILQHIEKVVAACKRHDKISGSAALGLHYARALLEHGVQYIAQGSDLGFIRGSAAVELKQLRAWREEFKVRRLDRQPAD